MGRAGPLLYRGEGTKKSNQKIKYMMNQELTTMESKNPKMFKKSFTTIIRINESLKNGTHGNGKTFKMMMENFECFRWLIHNAQTNEFKNDILTLMYASYRRDGNKFQSGFNDFFNYISKHSFSDIGDGDIMIFRVMSTEEFEKLQNEGNQNPCWSISIHEIEGFGLLKVISKETKRSVLVMAIYKSEDVIYYHNDKNFNNEDECWIKKGAKPKYSSKLFGFEKTYIKRRTGLILDEIDFDGKDSLNGFGWIDILKSKYGITLYKCSDALLSYTKVLEKRMNKYFEKNNLLEMNVIKL